MKKLILASGSPRRKELLEKLGIPFEVETGDFQKRSAEKSFLLVGHGRGLNTLLYALGEPPTLQRGEYRALDIV